MNDNNYLQKTQQEDQEPQPRCSSPDYPEERFTSSLYHFKVLYEFQWTAGTLRAGTSSIRKDLGQMGITGTKLGYGTNTHNGSSASEEGHTLKLDLVLCPLLPCHTKMLS